ncbi:hypothetical protein BDV93DRAFT_523152 [Ceratobasidium sp. AG-I]|nr:hypothetical protein BDV93DRAFT_523152 [Ceratobasidium sp. AG-I]
MAPCSPLVSHTLPPALYSNESPYTRKHRTYVLGRDALTASRHRVLSAPPKCKSEPKIEGFSDSDVDAMVQRAYAIKRAFYEKRRTEGDENPEAERACPEEGEDTKPDGTVQAVSAPDAGGNPDSEPADGFDPGECACNPLAFSLYGLREHRTRLNPIRPGDENNEADDSINHRHYIARPERNHATKPIPKPGELAAKTEALDFELSSGSTCDAQSVEDHPISNSPAPLLDFSSSGAPIQMDSHTLCSTHRPSFIKRAPGFEQQAVNSGGANTYCKYPRCSTDESGHLAPHAKYRDDALQLISRTTSPSYNRGALRSSASVLQSLCHHVLLARSAHPEVAHLLNGLDNCPQGVASSSSLVLRRRNRLSQCYHATKLLNTTPLRAAHSNHSWNQCYRGRASGPHGSNSSSGQGGAPFGGNSYSENEFTRGAYNSRDQLNEPQYDSVLDGETLFGEPFRQLSMAADTIGLCLSLYPKQFNPSSVRFVDQHSVPGPSQIPLPLLQHQLAPPISSTSYYRNLEDSNVLPHNHFSYPDHGRLGGSSNASFNAPPSRHVGYAVGVSGWAGPSTPSLPLHAQNVVAAPNALSAPPPPTATDTTSHPDRFISVRPTIEPFANGSTGTATLASISASPNLTNSASSGVNQLRRNSARKGSNKTCPECGRIFSRPHELADHMSSHNKVKTHICPDCKKGLATRSNLSRHRKKRVCMR